MSVDLEQDLQVRRARVQRSVGMAVSKAYPQHLWKVMVSDDGTVAQVICPGLSTKYGVVIHANQSQEAMDRKAIKLCGELLERYHMRRDVMRFEGDRNIPLGGLAARCR